MKKILFSFLLFLTAFLIQAQTIYWEEDLSSDNGWVLESENWSIQNSMLQFNGFPNIYDFNLSAISPSFILSEYAQELIITQFVNSFEQSDVEFAEISIINGSDETLLWEYCLVNGNWGNEGGEDIAFPMTDYAGQEVQLKFRAYGSSSYSWNWWNINGIKVTALFNNDLSIERISGPQSLDMNESALWLVEVKNLGANSQSDFSVDLYNIRTEELLASIIITEEIENNESYYIDFEWTPVVFQNTALYAEVTAVNDDFSENDFFDGYFVRVHPDIDFNVLVWDNDNNRDNIIDPEKGDLIQAEMGITRALATAGIEYELFTYELPDNLNDYDIIIATLGCYCLS